MMYLSELTICSVFLKKNKNGILLNAFYEMGLKFSLEEDSMKVKKYFIIHGKLMPFYKTYLYHLTS